MAKFFKEAVGGVVDAVGRGVDSNSRALFDRTLESTRSRGRIDCIEAKDMARAIERLPALKTELTAQELNAIQVAIGRRIPQEGRAQRRGGSVTGRRCRAGRGQKDVVCGRLTHAAACSPRRYPVNWYVRYAKRYANPGWYAKVRTLVRKLVRA
jgi:hypothetical protein